MASPAYVVLKFKLFFLKKVVLTFKAMNGSLTCDHLDENSITDPAALISGMENCIQNEYKYLINICTLKMMMLTQCKYLK